MEYARNGQGIGHSKKNIVVFSSIFFSITLPINPTSNIVYSSVDNVSV
ncbi:MAG: hypothetical protein ACM3ZS_02740 [Nitrososphaerota archaeon]